MDLTDPSAPVAQYYLTHKGYINPLMPQEVREEAARKFHVPEPEPVLPTLPELDAFDEQDAEAALEEDWLHPFGLSDVNGFEGHYHDFSFEDNDILNKK